MVDLMHAPLRRRHLAGCIISLFALTPLAHANTLAVTSCTDTGVGDTGNLRNTIALANEGDTIDLGQLTCPNSKISLLLGQIAIARNDLTMTGPISGPPFNVPPLVIDGGGNAPVGMFRHSGTGTLTISNLTLANGTITNNTQQAKGGCLYSAGSISARFVNVYHCIADTVSGKAYGGGIYTKGTLNAKYSHISNNSALATNGGTATGGGFFTKALVSLNYSTVSGNSATTTAAYGGCCGGGYTAASATIQSSTISGNTAHRVGGFGINAKNNTLTIRSSTISGNTATVGPIGGISSYAAYTNVSYSTVALNSAAMPGFGGAVTYSAGLAVRYGYLNMANSILANNGFGVSFTQNDLTLTGTAMLKNLNNNLVRTSAVVLPADTIRNQCPQLGKLRDNGGATQTQALLSHSPALDKGHIVIGPNEDQRGRQLDMTPFPFPRTSGLAPDIGAYEMQQNDIVFDTSFEGCP